MNPAIEHRHAPSQVIRDDNKPDGTPPKSMDLGADHRGRVEVAGAARGSCPAGAWHAA